MSAIIRSILSCCRSQEAEEDPERQQLLNPDIIPQAPVQEGRESARTTEEQEADKRALNAIINSTSDRLVSVSAPGPFIRPSSSLSQHSPSSSRSPSPTPSSPPRASSSTWRAADQPVKVISLSTALDPHQTPSPPASFLRSKQQSDGARAKRPASSHSLKTLTKSGAQTARNGVRPSPLGRRPTSDGDGEGEEESEGDDERFATAREGATLNGTAGKRSGRGALNDIPWEQLSQEEQQRVIKKEEELAEAIKKLEQSVETFSIKPVGPLIHSWPEST